MRRQVAAIGNIVIAAVLIGGTVALAGHFYGWGAAASTALAWLAWLSGVFHVGPGL